MSAMPRYRILCKSPTSFHTPVVPLDSQPRNTTRRICPAFLQKCQVAYDSRPLLAKAVFAHSNAFFFASETRVTHRCGLRTGRPSRLVASCQHVRTRVTDAISGQHVHGPIRHGSDAFSAVWRASAVCPAGAALGGYAPGDRTLLQGRLCVAACPGTTCLCIRVCIC